VEGPDREATDFEFEYEVIPIEREVPLRVFLKQAELEVMPSMSWINLSDQLMKKMKLPKGSLFRVFPIAGSVDDQDEEDHSYTITWEQGKQYWFVIIYDPAKDRHDHSKQVLMVDASNRTDTFVVPRAANIHQILDLWKRFLEVPADIEMHMQRGNGAEFYWSLETTKDLITYTLQMTNFHGDVKVFEGSPHFVADQIGRLLDIKMPPFDRCQLITRRGLGPRIIFDDEVVPLNLRMLRQHLLAWNLEGRILKAPQVTTWWVPYHLDAIMRYGHSVNTDIPDDPNEAEFPPTPWPDEVTIRVKSHTVPQVPAAPLPAGGSSDPSCLACRRDGKVQRWEKLRPSVQQRQG
jgi:hypothetical protein